MILNRQRRIRVPLKSLNEFSRRARKELRLPDRALAICLVSDNQIARWNRAYRGKAGPTDVLSFPANSRSSRPIRTAASDDYLGDIAIAPAVARRNARRFGRAFEDEMRILILHGMLHLMGYDHETDSGQMDRRERAARKALGLVR